MSVMVGTKVKEAAIWLPRFLIQLDQLEGNINRVVVMYGQSNDGSFSILDHWRKHVTKHNVEIYNDPYLPPKERHGAKLARVKQDIQRLLKVGNEEYYLNLDCDLVELPKNLIPSLMKDNLDIVAGMVWTEGHQPPRFFDTFVFRKDGCRFHPTRPPGLNEKEPFQVDSVSTCYLAKREVELAGKYENPYPHIPFCADLKAKGFSVWVDPRVNVTHVDLTRYGIAHHPLPHPFSLAPFIDNKGKKFFPEQVQAEYHYEDIRQYNEWLKENKPGSYKAIELFKDAQPLITASIKVYNEEEYLSYCLDSILPFVDEIDIAWGPVKRNIHAVQHEDSTEQILDEYAKKHSKIRVIKKIWESKEEIQRKLLEVCNGKWILFIDADEVIGKKDMMKVRRFCKENQHGRYWLGHAKLINFFHDWHHIAYSLNPLNPWYPENMPHPFLIWHDIPGLNFGFHTFPMDGFGRKAVPYTDDYRPLTKMLDVTILHFGSAISEEHMRDKVLFMSKRQRDFRGESELKPVAEDWWFRGEMPADFIIEEYKGRFPAVLRGHPMRKKRLIEVTETQPVYKFKRTDNNE